MACLVGRLADDGGPPLEGRKRLAPGRCPSRPAGLDVSRTRTSAPAGRLALLGVSRSHQEWLNVPFDCGIALCAHRDDHEAAMEYAAPYLAVSESHVARDPMGYSPEFSRRARAVPVWAAIRELGREGITALVDRCCAHARAIAEGLAALPGCEIVNDVVLNQVLFRFEDDERTQAILAAVQSERRGVDEPDHLGREVHDPHLRRRTGGRASATSSAPSPPLRGRLGARRRLPVSRPRARRSR